MANWKPFYKYKTSQYTQQKNAQQREQLQEAKKQRLRKKGRANNDYRRN